MSTVATQSGRNGVDTAKLFATVDAVKAHPEAARFRFSVHNRWISGTHNRNQVSTFFGVGAEQQHAATFAIDADHPAVLVGEDHAPTPAEFLLAAFRSASTWPPTDEPNQQPTTGNGGMTMPRVETLVVGAGQAGLAVSRCLAERGADHLVVERGRVADDSADPLRRRRGTRRPVRGRAGHSAGTLTTMAS